MSWFDDQGDIDNTGIAGGGATPDLVDQTPQSSPIDPSTINPITGQPFTGVSNLTGAPTTVPLPSTGGTPPATGGLPALSGRVTDPAIIKQYIASWAAMPGADPSLANDPDYWANTIISKGGLGSDNSQYWQNASVGPTAFFNNPNRESGDTAAAAPLSQIPQNYTPVPAFTPTPAPTYTPYTPTAAPTPTALPAPTPYTPPTADQARQTPGYQYALDTANQGYQRSAAAKGNLLSGGGIIDLANLDQNIADTNYSNLVNQGLAINNSNYGQQFNTTQANNTNALQNWQAQTNAGLSAAGLNLQGTNQQFQNTYLPLWNAYQSNVGQNQFGANYGLSANNQAFGQNLATNQFNLGAQNQNFNQGLQTNENAYNQYNTSQNAAFNQWLQLAQIGNPGNPYA